MSLLSLDAQAAAHRGGLTYWILDGDSSPSTVASWTIPQDGLEDLEKC